MFVMSVHIANKTGDGFITIARGLQVHADYDNKAIRQYIRDNFKEFYEEFLKGKSWTATIDEWV